MSKPLTVSQTWAPGKDPAKDPPDETYENAGVNIACVDFDAMQAGAEAMKAGKSFKEAHQAAVAAWQAKRERRPQPPPPRSDFPQATDVLAAYMRSCIQMAGGQAAGLEGELLVDTFANACCMREMPPFDAWIAAKQAFDVEMRKAMEEAAKGKQ